MQPNVIEERARVLLELESQPEAVALVRSVLSALAEPVAIGDELLADLKTAVSEACNNVVMHAYDSRPGPMLVAINITRHDVEVRVRDRGSGFRHLAAGEGHMGLGLAVITALATRAEFRTPRDGGTEVRMSFERHPDPARLEIAFDDQKDFEPFALAGDVVIRVDPISLMRPVVGRLTRAIAASSNFSTAGFSDLYPVTEALADYADHASDGTAVGVGIAASRRRLDLTAGPFRATAEAPGGLEQLVDSLSVEEIDAYERLRMTLLDRSR